MPSGKCLPRARRDSGAHAWHMCFPGNAGLFLEKCGCSQESSGKGSIVSMRRRTYIRQHCRTGSGAAMWCSEEGQLAAGAGTPWRRRRRHREDMRPCPSAPSAIFFRGPGRAANGTARPWREAPPRWRLPLRRADTPGAARRSGVSAFLASAEESIRAYRASLQHQALIFGKRLLNSALAKGGFGTCECRGRKWSAQPPRSLERVHFGAKHFCPSILSWRGPKPISDRPIVPPPPTPRGGATENRPRGPPTSHHHAGRLRAPRGACTAHLGGHFCRVGPRAEPALRAGRVSGGGELVRGASPLVTLADDDGDDRDDGGGGGGDVAPPLVVRLMDRCGRGRRRQHCLPAPATTTRWGPPPWGAVRMHHDRAARRMGGWISGLMDWIIGAALPGWRRCLGRLVLAADGEPVNPPAEGHGVRKKRGVIDWSSVAVTRRARVGNSRVHSDSLSTSGACVTTWPRAALLIPLSAGNRVVPWWRRGTSSEGVARADSGAIFHQAGTG
eukprot:scaffold604_cov384-Prasinococcus_capsulatus_cf.AAC.12